MVDLSLQIFSSFSKGIDYEDFDKRVRRLLGPHFHSNGYDTEEVLESVAEFAIRNREKVYLLSSSGQGKLKLCITISIFMHIHEVMLHSEQF